MYPLYTCITICTPMYTRYHTCIYTIYTPNTPLNPPHIHPIYLPIYALKQPIKQVRVSIEHERDPDCAQHAR